MESNSVKPMFHTTYWNILHGFFDGFMILACLRSVVTSIRISSLFYLSL